MIFACLKRDAIRLTNAEIRAEMRIGIIGTNRTKEKYKT